MCINLEQMFESMYNFSSKKKGMYTMVESIKSNIIKNLEEVQDLEILRLVNAIIEESNRINKKRSS